MNFRPIVFLNIILFLIGILLTDNKISTKANIKFKFDSDEYYIKYHLKPNDTMKGYIVKQYDFQYNSVPIMYGLNFPVGKGLRSYKIAYHFHQIVVSDLAINYTGNILTDLSEYNLSKLNQSELSEKHNLNLLGEEFIVLELIKPKIVYFYSKGLPKDILYVSTNLDLILEKINYSKTNIYLIIPLVINIIIKIIDWIKN